MLGSFFASDLDRLRKLRKRESGAQSLSRSANGRREQAASSSEILREKTYFTIKTSSLTLRTSEGM